MADTPLWVSARPVLVNCRQLAFVWLALLLAVVAFENGRHSVHHLNANETATCAIDGAAGHTPVVGSPPVVATPITLTVRRVVIEPTPPAPSTHPFSLDPGRAPPPSLSA